MSSSRAQLGSPRPASLAWPNPILHGGKGLKTWFVTHSMECVPITAQYSVTEVCDKINRKIA